jgi:hypothetical protein
MRKFKKYLLKKFYFSRYVKEKEKNRIRIASNVANLLVYYAISDAVYLVCYNKGNNFDENGDFRDSDSNISVDSKEIH